MRSAFATFSKTRWLHLAVVLAVLLGIFAYRIGSIDSTYMREDEEIAFRTTGRELIYTLRFQAEKDVHAPLWFASFWAWRQLAGSTEWAARVYSILLSMLTLALTYRLGKHWFGAARYGLLAILVLGVNAYAHIYALEIRPYALVILAAVVNMTAFDHWLRRRTLPAAVGYGAACALLLWIHYFLVFLIATQMLYLLFVRERRQLWPGAVVAGVTGFVLWLPWFPVFLSQINKLREVESASGAYRGAGIGSTTQMTSWPVIQELLLRVTNGQPLLYGVLLITGFALLWRQSRYCLALLWALGVPAISLAVNLVASVYTPRYVTYLIVGLALVIGAGLAVMPRGWRWLAAGVFAAVSLWALPDQLPERIPHRMIFQQIAAEAQPGDILYFEQGNWEDWLMQWQKDAYLPAFLRESIAETPEEAFAARRVWFITANWFDEDVQAAFRAVERDHPLQRVVGGCSRAWCYLAQLLEAPPLETPLVFGDQLPFYGAQIVSADQSALTVKLWWQAESPPAADYSISLRLLDTNGALVSQNDGALQIDGAVVQTSQLQPGVIYQDLRVLPIAGLPAGEYQLALVVYQSWDEARLTLTDGSDTLNLEPLTLPIPANN